MKQTWHETEMAASADGSALANSVVATSILNAGNRLSLKPNYFEVGKQLRLIACGRVSNIVTTPGTLTLEMRLGPTSNIAAFSSGAINFSTTAHTNVPWWFEIMLTCRAVSSGANSNLMGQGFIRSQALQATAVADSATGHGGLLVPNTAPAVGTGFDATVTNVLDLFATFSVANAGNAITCHQFSFQSLN